MSYPELLASIKTSGVPWPVIALGHKHGLKLNETCGNCAAYLSYLDRHVCGRAWSEQNLPADTTACRRFTNLTP